MNGFVDENKSLAFQLACVRENVLETLDLKEDLLFELNLYVRISQTNLVGLVFDYAAEYLDYVRASFSNRIGASADRASVMYAALVEISKYDESLANHLHLGGKNVGLTAVHTELAVQLLNHFEVLKVYSNA